MHGSIPTPQNNAWTEDAAAWIEAECGIDLQPHDIIQRVLQIRKTWGWDQESFDQCLRAFEEKVAGDALRDQQAHDVDDIKRENAFLKRTLQNTGV